MKKYIFNDLNSLQINELCKRCAINFSSIMPVVQGILDNVKLYGDKALKEYTEKFDGVLLRDFVLTEKEKNESCKKISKDLKNALKTAYNNIYKFHEKQRSKKIKVNTMPGIICFQEARAIEKVGLYIPGGSAPLFSTVFMLAIPAKIAGCKEIILCTPPDKNGNIANEIIYASKLCGINKIFKIGGAQSIAAMAYGTESIPKVYKIFGPGNQYVTSAKMLVSIDPNGCAIDMPAGPSEVLVIADEFANAEFVASDLLSQAEHGADSQSVLVCTNENKVNEILDEVQIQLGSLPRKEIAKKALENSFVLIVNDLKNAIFFSNNYAPEHLILNILNPNKYLNLINNAGSVFIGPYSCESAGDYASGTNHSLPTYGYAKVIGGVGVASFQKQITFQEITKKGAKNIGGTVCLMAEKEGLEAHKKAMELRMR